MELQEKEAKKSAYKEPTIKKYLFLLEAILIIGQKKAFYRKRILESSFVRKETVDIDILVISTNGERKSCDLSEYQLDLPSEWGSGTNWASYNEHLSK